MDLRRVITDLSRHGSRRRGGVVVAVVWISRARPRSHTGSDGSSAPTPDGIDDDDRNDRIHDDGQPRRGHRSESSIPPSHHPGRRRKKGISRSTGPVGSHVRSIVGTQASFVGFLLIQNITRYGFRIDWRRDLEQGNTYCDVIGTTARWNCPRFNLSDPTLRRAYFPSKKQTKLI